MLSGLSNTGFVCSPLCSSEDAIFKSILTDKPDLEHAKPWPSISSEAKDLVKRLLERDPAKCVRVKVFACSTLWHVHANTRMCVFACVGTQIHTFTCSFAHNFCNYQTAGE